MIPATAVPWGKSPRSRGSLSSSRQSQPRQSSTKPLPSSSTPFDSRPPPVSPGLVQIAGGQVGAVVRDAAVHHGDRHGGAAAGDRPGLGDVDVGVRDAGHAAAVDLAGVVEPVLLAGERVVRDAPRWSRSGWARPTPPPAPPGAARRPRGRSPRAGSPPGGSPPPAPPRASRPRRRPSAVPTRTSPGTHAGPAAAAAAGRAARGHEGREGGTDPTSGDHSPHGRDRFWRMSTAALRRDARVRARVVPAAELRRRVGRDRRRPPPSRRGRRRESRAGSRSACGRARRRLAARQHRRGGSRRRESARRVSAMPGTMRSQRPRRRLGGAVAGPEAGAAGGEDQVGRVGRVAHRLRGAPPGRPVVGDHVAAHHLGAARPRPPRRAPAPSGPRARRGPSGPRP